MEKEKQLAIFEQNIGVNTVPYIAVGGGKGGVGKTMVTYLLAKRLSKLGKVLVLDADMGLPDFYILSGVKPKRYLEEYFEGKATLDDIVTKIDHNLYLMSPKSGDDYLVSLDNKQAMELLTKLEEYIVNNYNYFLIDLGAGIHKINQLIFATVHYPVLVVTPDIMSIIDAYAFVKSVFQNFRKTYFYAIVNQTRSDLDYKKTINVLRKSVKSFHKNIEIEGLGHIPFDSRLSQGDIPEEINKHVDEILRNLLKDRFKIVEEKKGFWSKIASFFRR
ncbi:MAG: P-loop NTPase [Aquificota bacterium]